MLKIDSHAITDTGLTRKINEDNCSILKEQNLFLVSDGLGGHAAGELASQITVTAIKNFIKTSNEDDQITWPFGINNTLSLEENKIVTAIRIANQTIYHKAQNQKEYAGMGATVVVMLVKDSQAVIAHVGDSRLYRIRQNNIKQLTLDHSWVREQVEKGLLSEQQAQIHHLKNVVTRALGTASEVEVDVKTKAIEAGDYFILCSDGLSNLVDNETIKNIVLKNKNNVSLACQNLVDMANSNGGIDNITVVIVYFDGENRP